MRQVCIPPATIEPRALDTPIPVGAEPEVVGVTTGGRDAEPAGSGFTAATDCVAGVVAATVTPRAAAFFPDPAGVEPPADPSGANGAELLSSSAGTAACRPVAKESARGAVACAESAEPVCGVGAPAATVLGAGTATMLGADVATLARCVSV